MFTIKSSEAEIKTLARQQGGHDETVHVEYGEEWPTMLTPLAF